MNFKSFFFFISIVFIITSCKSTSKSSSPYLTEEISGTEITIREEKVTPVDHTDEILYRYYVIIGSFKVIENARKYRSELVKEGFNPVILENENGLFRISAGAYNDEKQARNRIAQIRKDFTKHNDVWLLKRK